MNRQKKYSFMLVLICVILVAGVATVVVSAQQEKVVSSYGPTNQDVTFDQIKASRMAVKAERAKQHMEMLNSRYDLSKKTTSDSGGRDCLNSKMLFLSDKLLIQAAASFLGNVSQ
ncbi:hypothetical protein [Desulfobacterium sp. N47]|uniref:Uncharacterized protein n=1 Tax=uncultured Desulfobacterium sp. TaxID=201089 RepID=E1YH43_9BACT|nr:unknown protein [uncultured Desulfobacterium sp.]